MRKIWMVLLVFVGLFVQSCNKNVVFDEYSGGFADLKWLKTHEVSFEPQVDDADVAYEVFLNFRHAYGFNVKVFKLLVTLKDPDGNESTKKVDLSVFNNKGTYESECMGDICDYQVQLDENYKFAKPGRYTYRIQHMMGDKEIAGVMDVGLKIEKISK